MIRVACLFVLLSGCAASRPASSPAPPASLADVNAALDGRTVRIDMAERVVAENATEVRLTPDSVFFRVPPDTTVLRSAPSSSVLRILGPSERTGRDLRGPIAGAAAGFVLARLLQSQSGGRRSVGTPVLDGVARGGSVVIAVVAAWAGAGIGHRFTNPRTVVLFQGPVERYLAAPTVSLDR